MNATDKETAPAIQCEYVSKTYGRFWSARSRRVPTSEAAFARRMLNDPDETVRTITAKHDQPLTGCGGKP
jgi:hypothetical protein